MVLECAIEKYLDVRVRALGGITIKLNPLNNKGIPDRLVILPGLPALFVELKRPHGGRLAELQKMWHKRLLAMGQTAHHAQTEAEVDKLISSALEAQERDRHSGDTHRKLPRNA